MSCSRDGICRRCWKRGARAKLRDGHPRFIPAEDVVPAETVLLSAGKLVPADAIPLDATDFYVKRAVLTGRTFPVERTPGPSAGSGEAPVAAQASLAARTNWVFVGTNVRSTTGCALIVAGITLIPS